VGAQLTALKYLFRRIDAVAFKDKKTYLKGLANLVKTLQGKFKLHRMSRINFNLRTSSIDFFPETESCRIERIPLSEQICKALKEDRIWDIVFIVPEELAQLPAAEYPAGLIDTAITCALRHLTLHGIPLPRNTAIVNLSTRKAEASLIIFRTTRSDQVTNSVQVEFSYGPK